MTVEHMETIAITRRASGRTVSYRVPIDAALSRPEAAALLSVSLRHVYRLIKAARLPIVHERGDIHIPIAALLDYRDRRSALRRTTRVGRARSTSTLQIHDSGSSPVAENGN